MAKKKSTDTAAVEVASTDAVADAKALLSASRLAQVDKKAASLGISDPWATAKARCEASGFGGSPRLIAARVQQLLGMIVKYDAPVVSAAQASDPEEPAAEETSTEQILADTAAE